ncbi:diguanylate cyclase domain-containing protein [Thioalkalivibrio sp. AKL12]|uniref:sensor domain-containing diguanylate cyclase n=1 Tax=Thioalkalivibrio sp. AKL12 TaxID=1158159 RepID=UPI0003666631|nr:diguanylate cyclase [Thioalkalivibrio sp. AKL12]
MPQSTDTTEGSEARPAAQPTDARTTEPHISGPIVAALIAGLLFALLFVAIDQAWKQQMADRYQQAVVSEASSVRTRLESVLNGSVHATIGLAAYAYVHPDLTEDDFDRAADRLYRSQPDLIRSLTLARGETLALVYPRDGNEGAIGLNLAEHPEQGASYREVLERRQTVVAGPWTLAQGGRGLLVRAPVLTDPEDSPELVNPWTLSSIALDFDTVLSEAGLAPRPPDLQLALRGLDGTGADGEVFYNPEQIDVASAPLALDVTFAGGQWQMLAHPVPNPSATERPAAWWVMGVVGLLAVSGYTFRVGEGIRQRREALTRYQGLVNSLADATLVVAGRHVLWGNPAFTRMTGLSPDPGQTLSALGVIQADDRRRLPPELDFSMALEDPRGREIRVHTADGAQRFHLLRWVPIDWEGQRAFLLSFVDVHDNRMLFNALSEARDLQDALFEAMPGDALVIDDTGLVRAVFGEARRGQAPQHTAAGHTLAELLPDEVAQRFSGVVRRALREGELQEIQYRLQANVFHGGETRPSPEESRWYEARVRPIDAPFEGSSAVVWHALDVTERKQLEERMQALAWEDPLTRTANRAALDRAFPRLAARADRKEGQLALLFIDLDRFKPVNDRYGHAVGDELLRQLAQRLAASLRSDDLLVRLGGDEFIVLSAPLNRREEAGRLIERLQAAFRQPFELHPGHMEPVEESLSCSIGVAFYPRDGQRLADLMMAADHAMYRVKAAGRNDVSYASEAAPESGTE